MKKFKYLFPALLIFALSCKDSDESTASPSTEPTIISNNVGDFSKNFLANDEFTTLEIQMAHEPNVRPSQTAVDSLQQFLQRRLNKNSITFIYTPIPDQGKTVYSIADIREIEKTYKTASASNSEATAFFFFADGNYDQDAGNSVTLGVAFNATSMALFQKTIMDNTGGLGQPSKNVVEEGVLKHEFGHIMGLVNLGSPLQSAHEDNAHPKHCETKSCLMYFAIETGDFFSNLIGGSVPDLDPPCIADLRANGGK